MSFRAALARPGHRGICLCADLERKAALARTGQSALQTVPQLTRRRGKAVWNAAGGKQNVSVDWHGDSPWIAHPTSGLAPQASGEKHGLGPNPAWQAGTHQGCLPCPQVRTRPACSSRTSATRRGEGPGQSLRGPRCPREGQAFSPCPPLPLNQLALAGIPHPTGGGEHSPGQHRAVLRAPAGTGQPAGTRRRPRRVEGTPSQGATSPQSSQREAPGTTWASTGPRASGDSPVPSRHQEDCCSAPPSCPAICPFLPH